MMPHLQIAVCTYKRPVMLHTCIKSIIRAKLPAEYKVTVLVIDNDNDQSARPIVDDLSHESPVPIDYIVEKRRGIPVARNKALQHAIDRNVCFLVFIDDDEYASENWLIKLVSYAEEKGGQAAIHGRVITEYPVDASKNLQPFFTKKTEPTGTSLNSCSTDNVLIPLQKVIEHNLRFDETYPLIGGTDTLFFSMAHQHGVAIFSCAEAIVHETIPASRANIKWLSRRKYRLGIGRVTRRKPTNKTKARHFLQAVTRIALKTINCLFYLILRNKRKAIQSWLKACQTAGTVAGLLGIQYNEYSSIHGK